MVDLQSGVYGADAAYGELPERAGDDYDAGWAVVMRHGTWARSGNGYDWPGKQSDRHLAKAGQPVLCFWGAGRGGEPSVQGVRISAGGETCRRPEKMRDEALETFRQWDLFKYEQDRGSLLRNEGAGDYDCGAGHGVRED